MRRLLTDLIALLALHGLAGAAIVPRAFAQQWERPQPVPSETEQEWASAEHERERELWQADRELERELEEARREALEEGKPAKFHEKSTPSNAWVRPKQRGCLPKCAQ